MTYKKYLLYLDKNDKQRFQEKDISKDELDQIEYGIEIKNKLDEGISINKVNVKGKPYISLLKTMNRLREGNPNIFDRVIYFEKKDSDLAQKKMIKSFENIMKGRDYNSLQNLGFITEMNLAFVGSLKVKKGNVISTKKQKKDGIK